MALSFYSCNS